MTIPPGTQSIRRKNVTLSFICSATITVPDVEALWKFLNYCAERNIQSPTTAHVAIYMATMPEHYSWEWDKLSNINLISRTLA